MAVVCANPTLHITPPRLKMSGAIPPLPPYTCMVGMHTALPLRAQNAKFF